MALMVAIVVLASKMNEMDFEGNFTNLTQALDDWSAKSWVDFTLTDNQCQDGYEAIKNTWKGTVESNISMFDETREGKIPASEPLA